MALPSAVTLGSLAFVAAAGVGLVAVASNASEDPPQTPASHRPSDTEKQAGDAKPTVDKPAKPQPKPQHKKGPPHRHTNPVPKVFVEVYNNSGITGLAAGRAHQLERAGWNVTATDNWYGNIPDNTVYFPDRLRAQARQLAEVLHITRVRPAVSPMQFDRLTVIYTHP